MSLAVGVAFVDRLRHLEEYVTHVGLFVSLENILPVVVLVTDVVVTRIVVPCGLNTPPWSDERYSSRRNAGRVSDGRPVWPGYTRWKARPWSQLDGDPTWDAKAYFATEETRNLELRFADSRVFRRGRRSTVFRLHRRVPLPDVLAK